MYVHTYIHLLHCLNFTGKNIYFLVDKVELYEFGFYFKTKQHTIFQHFWYNRLPAFLPYIFMYDLIDIHNFVCCTLDQVSSVVYLPAPALHHTEQSIYIVLSVSSPASSSGGDNMAELSPALGETTWLNWVQLWGRQHGRTESSSGGKQHGWTESSSVGDNMAEQNHRLCGRQFWMSDCCLERSEGWGRERVSPLKQLQGLKRAELSWG